MNTFEGRLLNHTTVIEVDNKTARVYRCHCGKLSEYIPPCTICLAETNELNRQVQEDSDRYDYSQDKRNGS